MRSINFFSVLLIISAIVFLPANLFSRVTIGSTDSPQDFSVLELFSNETMGFRLPQLSEYQRDNHLTPMLEASEIDPLTGVSLAMGLQIFNTTNFCVETWNGWEWISLCDGEIPFELPPHFDEGCHTNPAFVACFAGLRRLATTVRQLADVTNSGNHAANARSVTALGERFYMMPVTGGVFYRGETNVQGDPNFFAAAASAQNTPVHQTGVNSFYIAQTEVTRELFAAVMNFAGTVGGHTLTAVPFSAPNHPEGFGVGNLPQNQISWYAAVVFMNRLSVITERTPVFTLPGVEISDFLNTPPPTAENFAWDAITQDLSANGFRFPTEAEWEYAARGGQMNEYTRTLGASGEHYAFSGSSNAAEVSRHGRAPFDNVVTYVRSLAPNQLGIYDMSGNVSEWVWDRWYGVITPYGACCAVNPTGLTGTIETDTRARISRGGAFHQITQWTRVSHRTVLSPVPLTAMANGLRLAWSAQ